MLLAESLNVFDFNQYLRRATISNIGLKKAAISGGRMHVTTVGTTILS